MTHQLVCEGDQSRRRDTAFSFTPVINTSLNHGFFIFYKFRFFTTRCLVEGSKLQVGDGPVLLHKWTEHRHSDHSAVPPSPLFLLVHLPMVRKEWLAETPSLRMGIKRLLLGFHEDSCLLKKYFHTTLPLFCQLSGTDSVYKLLYTYKV